MGLADHDEGDVFDDGGSVLMLDMTRSQFRWNLQLLGRCGGNDGGEDQNMIGKLALHCLSSLYLSNIFELQR